MIFRDKEVMARVDTLEEKLSKMEKKIDALMRAWGIETDEECWLPVLRNGEETKCEVSNLGNVRRIEEKTPCPTYRNPSGKLGAAIYYTNEGKAESTSMLIENIVARAFLDPTLSKKSKLVCHIDGDLDNNRVDNLYIRAAKI